MTDLFERVLALAALAALSAGCREDTVADSAPIDEPATGGLDLPVTEPNDGTGGTGNIYIIPVAEEPGGPVCGDKAIEAGEDCEDGNVADGDGCSALCLREPGYICLNPGEACILEVCGDGSRTASETCDDANAVPGDGCDAACQVEGGWVCPTPGAACLPRCGDGLVVGSERCDDANVTSGDGCAPNCLVEPGWFGCPPAGAACQAAACGNGVVEANEGCDDANDVSGDGCNAVCLREPAFDASGMTAAVCGDGARTLGEDCDDGNVMDGDGCSAACAVEIGFECTEVAEQPEVVKLPVVFRDFTEEHPDFEYLITDLELGIPGEVCTVATAAACGLLDAEGKPVFAAAGTFRSVNDATTFSQWYRDVPDVNLPFPSSLELVRMVEDEQTVYRFESDEFFPLDGMGFPFPLEPEDPEDPEDPVGPVGPAIPDHNFLFTTELQYFIQYEGGERLEFSGDDDVWIYVNRRLAVDIGGVHGVESDFVLLGDEDGDGEISATEADDPTDDRFGITKGSIYSIHLFHAERHTIYSNFKLTLSNFILSRSVCNPICGSGTLEPGEMCDDGVEANTGEYGACAPDCSGRKFCGDGVVQAEGGELCDDGLNLSPYNSPEGGCAPGCQPPARCGDEVIDAAFGETCDLGAANGARNSTCDERCRLKDVLR